jgi:two-component system OmpR family sensor kinase
MSQPGEPGYAAASRKAFERTSRPAAMGSTAIRADASGEPSTSTRSGFAGTRLGRAPFLRGPWTIRRRLLVLIAGLLVAMSVVVGVATVLLFNATSVARLDASLRAASSRADDATEPGFPSDAGATVRSFLGVPGQPEGTLGGLAFADGATAAYISEGQVIEAGPAATSALVQVPADGAPHTIRAGALGEYRALAVESQPGVRTILALPLAEVSAQTTQLAITVGLVAAGGVLFAVGAGSLLVRRSLDPLERVTATAQSVSEMPLERGDVDLDERVPVDDARTEVGRLGTAFNNMLGHVASALSAREESERKVRRFVADASHELRTPLASIRGYAELTRLHGGSLPEDIVHAIGRIESESLRMTELVEDLLLLARLDDGRELVAGEVELGPIVADAVADAQVAGPDHEWAVELPDEPVVVHGDEARLRQVLGNLLTNARMHTPEGTSVVATLRADASSATITVADDGPGIEPELRTTLFERFARGDSSRSRRAGSTGLGLAIVRAVVEAHHGTVSVDSIPGRTTFTVKLPLR